MYDSINLNFINKSEDLNNKSIVIFQKNVAEDSGENSIAWKVIKNCGRFENHPFVLPLNFEIGGQDSWGNFTLRSPSFAGMAFEFAPTSSGFVLQVSSSLSKDSNQVEISNKLPYGAVNAVCFKDRKILAVKNNLAPGQTAAFEFHPRIYIGVVSEVIEGSIMNSAILSKVNTEINLLGIREADIIMTGGGTGNHAEAFDFTLENVIKI